MYFPNSQIETNLYSSNEFVILETGQPYTGFYWTTSTGKYYAGKTPDSTQSTIELIKFKKNSASDISAAEPSLEETPQNQEYKFSTKTLSYLNLRGIDSPKAPRLPKYIPPSPTLNDYKVGEFSRYFCKKNSESLFLEISQKEYQQLKTKAKSIDFYLYTPFILPWAISGEQDKVALTNKNTVDYKEQRENLLGLSQYLKNNYLQLFDFTPGIIKQGLSRVYRDSGQTVPTNLPPSYHLGNMPKHKGQQCSGCTFYKAGLCQRWNAKIEKEFWCKSYKKNVSTSEETISSPSTTNTPSQPSNIYTGPTNTGLEGESYGY